MQVGGIENKSKNTQILPTRVRKRAMHNSKRVDSCSSGNQKMKRLMKVTVKMGATVQRLAPNMNRPAVNDKRAN